MRTILIAAIIFIILLVIIRIRSRKVRSAANTLSLREVGMLLYSSRRVEFLDYFDLYLTDAAQFAVKYADPLKRHYGEVPHLPDETDVFYIFSTIVQASYVVDWRGEEDENEVEAFVESRIGQKLPWQAVRQLRGTVPENTRDGRFIIDLFTAMDQDLQQIDMGLLFFDTGGDSYVLHVTDRVMLQRLSTDAPSYFHGVEKLRR